MPGARCGSCPNIMNKIIQGHTLDVLKGLESESVDCVITSPPYWSLRDYKSEPIIWGNQDCQHEWGDEYIKKYSPMTEGFQERCKQFGGHGGSKEKPPSEKALIALQNASQKNFCLHCNAWKGQLGLEPTFELYINHLIQIFDEVKRVLKKTGTLWVNLGDSYSSSVTDKRGTYTSEKRWQHGLLRSTDKDKFINQAQAKELNLPSKSLCNIPHRFAIAMTDRLGMILRNTLIWHKPNCMPQSAKDRFTVDFEYVFFFTKSQKYYFKQLFEPHTRLWDESNGGNLSADSTYFDDGTKLAKMKHSGDYPLPNPQGRNKRCVWQIPTQPNPEAHFATFPNDLVQPMIEAGCPENGIVMDIFAGTGTTCYVAKEMGRDYLGIELNPEYREMADKKNAQAMLL